MLMAILIRALPKAGNSFLFLQFAFTVYRSVKRVGTRKKHHDENRTFAQNHGKAAWHHFNQQITPPYQFCQCINDKGIEYNK